MHRSHKERVGYIKGLAADVIIAHKQAILSGTMAAVMLISLCLPLGTLMAERVDGQNGRRHRRNNRTDHSRSVNAGEVADTLADVDGVMESSDQTAVSSDEDSAINAATAGATIDIPKDANRGVTIDSDNPDQPSIDIELPNADQTQDAKEVSPGVVAYEGTDGSANAVQAMEDGGVRMLTIIDNPDAPTEYEYRVTVPNGGHIEVSEQGGAIILDGLGLPTVSVDAPWAKDASNRAIDTWFTTDGATLTQHVEHNIPGIVYPVTADPWYKPWTWGVKGWQRVTGVVIFSGGCIVSLFGAPSVWIPIAACSAAAHSTWMLF